MKESISEMNESGLTVMINTRRASLAAVDYSEFTKQHLLQRPKQHQLVDSFTRRASVPTVMLSSALQDTCLPLKEQMLKNPTVRRLSDSIYVRRHSISTGSLGQRHRSKFAFATGPHSVRLPWLIVALLLLALLISVQLQDKKDISQTESVNTKRVMTSALAAEIKSMEVLDKLRNKYGAAVALKELAALCGRLIETCPSIDPNSASWLQPAVSTPGLHPAYDLASQAWLQQLKWHLHRRNEICSQHVRQCHCAITGGIPIPLQIEIRKRLDHLLQEMASL